MAVCCKKFKFIRLMKVGVAVLSGEHPVNSELLQNRKSPQVRLNPELFIHLFEKPAQRDLF
jgi:hypothetical protein